MIAHAKVERFEDPESPLRPLFAPAQQACGGAGQRVVPTPCCSPRGRSAPNPKTPASIANAPSRTQSARTAANASCGRVGGPTCVAKNRYGITEELPLSWPAFIRALTNKQATQGANAMADLRGFDANQVEPATTSIRSLHGKYLAVITDQKMKPNKAGTGSNIYNYVSNHRRPVQGPAASGPGSISTTRTRRP